MRAAVVAFAVALLTALVLVAMPPPVHASSRGLQQWWGGYGDCWDIFGIRAPSIAAYWRHL